MKLKWNKYIPKEIVPSATQTTLTMLPHLDALFGGAAGGGKSVILLANALQYVDIPGYAALILRRTLAELKQPQALLDLARQWLGNTDAKYLPEDHTYEFPTRWPDGSSGPPSKLQFGYLGEHNAEIRYQGAAYQFVGIDECTHFENDGACVYLFSRLRKPVCPTHKLKKGADGLMEPNYLDSCKICQMYKGLPLRFRLASNPGGPGHHWVKQRYQIEKEIYVDPTTGESKVRWVGKDPNHPFIPSSLRDNEYIDQSSYRQSLSNLDEIRRQQLEEGDWDISPDSRFNTKWARFYTSRGDYFQLGSNVYHVDDLEMIFITVDPAASSKAGPIDVEINKKKKGPSFTVISVWGLTKDFQLIWMHMKRFREEIPYVIEQIQASYLQFPCKYVAVETNGLGIGPAQILAARGIRLFNNRKSVDKIQNAANAIYRMKSGRVWFPESASWLKVCMDEIFAWTGHPGVPDDVVDTLSDACNIVTSLGQGRDPLMELDPSSYRHSLPNNSPVIHQLPPIPNGSSLSNPYDRVNSFFN